MTTRLRRCRGLALLGLAAGLAAGAPSAEAEPPPSKALVRIVEGPPGSWYHPEAIFRFTSRAPTLACRRDRLPYHPCRGRVKYSGLRPGRHRFMLRARLRGRTVYVRRHWTVRQRKGEGFAPVPPAGIHADVVGRAPGTPGASPRRLVFSDEFDGTALNLAAWRPFDGDGHSGPGLRRPSALSLDGAGHLVVTARPQGARIVTGGASARTDFTYGRVVFRVRTEPDPTGTMSGVVLTWPQRQWSPEYTENDMYETGPRIANRSAFETFIHFGPTTKWQKWTTHNFDPSRWHTIAMEWYPGLLEIYVDGLLGLSISDPAVIADVAHHVCIQLDARRNRPLQRPVRMFVDYVRVYQ